MTLKIKAGGKLVGEYLLKRSFGVRIFHMAAGKAISRWPIMNELGLALAPTGVLVSRAGLRLTVVRDVLSKRKGE